MDSDEDVPSTSGFFSKRVTYVPRKNSDDLQAAAELVDKLEKKSAKELKSLPPSKKAKMKLKKDDFELLDNREECSSDDSLSQVILSPAAKRRLKKLREDQARELERIDAENQKILSAVSSDFSFEKETAPVEAFEKLHVLTIKYMSHVARLTCYENNTFLDIFRKVADIFGLKVTDFLLGLKDRIIAMDDTPKSLQLDILTEIDCIPCKICDADETAPADSGNTLQVIFQSNNTTDKTVLYVHKLEKMKNIMQRYAEKRGIQIEQLTFEFDGERLCDDDTPIDLDMETESLIDVTVSDDLDPTPNSSDIASTIPVPSSNGINVFVPVPTTSGSALTVATPSSSGIAMPIPAPSNGNAASFPLSNSSGIRLIISVPTSSAKKGHNVPKKGIKGSTVPKIGGNISKRGGKKGGNISNKGGKKGFNIPKNMCKPPKRGRKKK